MIEYHKLTLNQIVLLDNPKYAFFAIFRIQSYIFSIYYTRKNSLFVIEIIFCSFTLSSTIAPFFVLIYTIFWITCKIDVCITQLQKKNENANPIELWITKLGGSSVINVLSAILYAQPETLLLNVLIVQSFLLVTIAILLNCNTLYHHQKVTYFMI